MVLDVLYQSAFGQSVFGKSAFGNDLDDVLSQKIFFTLLYFWTELTTCCRHNSLLDEESTMLLSCLFYTDQGKNREVRIFLTLYNLKHALSRDTGQFTRDKAKRIRFR